MNLIAIRDRLDIERRTLHPFGTSIEILDRVTRVAATSDAWHSIAFSDLNEENADDVIDEQFQHYQSLGHAVEWKVYAHDRPTDLRGRLANRGFEVGPLEAVLVQNLQNAPDWHSERLEHVVTVQTPEQLELFRTAMQEMNSPNADETIAELAACIRDNCTDNIGYMAIEQGKAVSIGRLYTNPSSHFGGLYGGATLPSHRGRGHYRATVAARAIDAARLGARYLIVDALPTSRPILERLGFIHLTDTWPCLWRP